MSSEQKLVLGTMEPLAFFDLETTGVNTTSDRIVQVAVAVVAAGKVLASKEWLVNPGSPIPPESTIVHGITDDDVEGKPAFCEIVDDLLNFIGDMPLAGYNSASFDLPMLFEEVRRSGRGLHALSLINRKHVDVMHLYRDLNPGTLSGVYRRYTGKELEGAHDAMTDTIATAEILTEMIISHKLGATVDELDELSRGGCSDLARKLKLNEDGEPCFTFGKHQGETVKSVARTDRNYIRWIQHQDFPQETKEQISLVITGGRA